VVGTSASALTSARALCRMVKAVATPEAASAVPTAPLSHPNASSCGRVGCQATAVTLSVRPCQDMTSQLMCGSGLVLGCLEDN